MGHVLVKMKVENIFDWAKAQQSKGKKRPPIRSVVVNDALVDTGATYLSLPSRMVKALGLIPRPKQIKAETATGQIKCRMYTGALLTVNGRTEECAVMELPDKAPPLLGVIPLEGLDFVVDPLGQKLVGKHGRNRVSLLY